MKGRIQKISKANGQRSGYLLVTGNISTAKVYRTRKAANKGKRGLKI